VIAFIRCAFRAGVVAGLLAVVSACSAGHASASATPTPAPAPARTHLNVVYGQSAQGLPVTADLFSPTAAKGPAPVVIVIHGGSWDTGDKQATDPYAQALASTGFVTVSVNYTLSTPAHPGYPEQVQEIQRAIQWSIANASRYGGDPHRLALVGFSAGAYLAAQAGLLDSGLPGRPIKAVVTLSAPLDFVSIDKMIRARVAVCGYRPSCPQQPQDPAPSAFATLFNFLGCPTGHCSSQLLREASPSNHVTAQAPAFQIFNSSDELIPRSQATEMGDLLRSAGVPEQVTIIPGSQHGEAYLPTVSPAISKFLGHQLGLPQVALVTPSGTPASPYGTPTVLIVCCALVAAGSLGVILLALRRRTAGYR